jgi:hypothetical protein
MAIRWSATASTSSRARAFDGPRDLNGELDVETLQQLADMPDGEYLVGEDGQPILDPQHAVQEQVAQQLGEHLAPVHETMSKIVGHQVMQDLQQAATMLASEFPALSDPGIVAEVEPVAVQWARELGIAPNDPRFFSRIRRTAYLSHLAMQQIQEEQAAEAAGTTDPARLEAGAGSSGGASQPAGFLEQIAQGQDLGTRVLPFQLAQAVEWDDRYHGWSQFQG